MTFKNFSPFLLFFVFVGCVTAPVVKSFFVAPGVVQYFLPSTEWTVKKSPKMKAQLDITYRTGVETPPVVNISFINTKKNIGRVSAASLSGNGTEYPLRDITVFYFDPEKRELRISSTGDRDTLADVLEADDIVLKAVVDGAEYVYTPEKNFFILKDQFTAGIRH
jgi:hypothetical protein